MASQLFEDIKAGLEEAIAISKGLLTPDPSRVHHVEVEELDVDALRKQME